MVVNPQALSKALMMWITDGLGITIDDDELRAIIIDGETKHSACYAVTSLPRDQVDAATLLMLWRGRWDIENHLFWVRDVVFQEDLSRIRTAPHRTYHDERVSKYRNYPAPRPQSPPHHRSHPRTRC